ncbi:hypothetical protein [Geomonas edaphica]|uniref:hypothetical protein n=1 Tax=Geomonas edaphica TaxID=2570226 RepID=UPI0010A82930|nr:hypothetical protein [Geomonas edaphica]
MPRPPTKHLEIFHQQILLPDSSVFSVQWIDLPSSVSLRAAPTFLLEHYFKVVRRATFGMITPVADADGVRFRVTGTGLSLLSFAPPRFETIEGAHAVHLYICGGFLVQPGECDNGMFSLVTAPAGDGIRVTVRLSDYCPLLLGSRTPSRLRKLLYGWTQSYLHKVVTVRYLASLYHELTGVTPRVRVTRVQVRQGTDI